MLGIFLNIIIMENFLENPAVVVNLCAIASAVVLAVRTVFKKRESRFEHAESYSAAMKRFAIFRY